VILVVAPPWWFETAVVHPLEILVEDRQDPNGLTTHMGCRISNQKKSRWKILTEDTDFTKTGVVLALTEDTPIVHSVEKRAIGSKLVMSCMNTQQVTQR
jgi:hypothetical protein